MCSDIVTWDHLVVNIVADKAMGMPWALLPLLIESRMRCTARSGAAADHNSRTMSNILELNCWVIGDDPRHVILVEVPSSKTVGYLKKAIKNEIEHSFDNFDAKSLDLWKVSNH